MLANIQTGKLRQAAVGATDTNFGPNPYDRVVSKTPFSIRILIIDMGSEGQPDIWARENPFQGVSRIKNYYRYIDFGALPNH